MSIGMGIGMGIGNAHNSRWTPAKLGAALGGWWSEASVFDGAGWAPVSGGAALTSAALPTTSTRVGRRILVGDGTQYVVGAFTRSQTTETWIAGAFVGATPAANKALFSGAATSGALLRLTTGTGRDLRIAAGTNVACTAVSNVADRWAVYGARFAGASSLAWDNGTQIGTGNANTGAPGGLALGGHGSGASIGPFQIGEAITTIGALSDADRSKLVAYLTAKWGIA